MTSPSAASTAGAPEGRRQPTRPWLVGWDDSGALARATSSRFFYYFYVADASRRRDARPQSAPAALSRLESDSTVPPKTRASTSRAARRGKGRYRRPIGFERPFSPGRYHPTDHIPKKLPFQARDARGGVVLFHGSRPVMSGLVNQPGMHQRFAMTSAPPRSCPSPSQTGSARTSPARPARRDGWGATEAYLRLPTDRVSPAANSQGGYITYRMVRVCGPTVRLLGRPGSASRLLQTAPARAPATRGPRSARDRLSSANLRWIRPSCSTRAPTARATRTPPRHDRAFLASDDVSPTTSTPPRST